jgi:ATP-dependent DNA helicase RecG
MSNNTTTTNTSSIAKFLMQLGWVEELGSGVLNVSKYWQAYGKAAKPQFIEGATFKIVLPVNDNFFAGTEEDINGDDTMSDAINSLIDGGANGGVSGGVNGGVSDGARKEIIKLVTIIMSKEGLKAFDIAEKRGKAIRTIERYLKLARQFGIVEFRGASKTGGYYITPSLKDKIENKRTE